MSFQQPPNDDHTTYTPPQQYTQYPQTPYPPPPYMQPPPKRKRRLWPWIVGGIVALVVISAALGNQNTPQPTSSAPPTATEQLTTPFTNNTPAPTQAPTKPPTWTTVQKFSGNGSKKTSSFTVPDNWRIAWSCKPGSFGGTDYNMIITVENTDGSYADSGVNSICSKNNTHDTTNVPAGGTFLLDILSEGDWSIAVQVLQ